MQIRMTEKEADLFRAFVTRSKGYFEFGIGGSTVFAASVVAGPVIAVDSDRTWIDTVTASLVPSAHPRRLLHADIGPTGEWGYPASSEHSDRFPLYARAILDVSEEIDLCLVDGRFRVACFLQALRHLRGDAVIGIHDYRSRAQYHVVEAFARVVAEAEDLSLFLRRPGIDEPALMRGIETYGTIPT